MGTNPSNTHVDTLVWGELPQPAPVDDETLMISGRWRMKDRYQVSLLLPCSHKMSLQDLIKSPDYAKFIQYQSATNKEWRNWSVKAYIGYQVFWYGKLTKEVS